ncbi:hypothetical protein AYI70_g291 [Smittium culicis]|uniref:Uncharacterized protein n=1 Tax=Smittium culicis TaxID=133412 RepID=A0A1R1YH75_9FUNG|nr:hypothetical protein AYI70_g291 [Smittium culicis]
MSSLLRYVPLSDSRTLGTPKAARICSQMNATITLAFTSGTTTTTSHLILVAGSGPATSIPHVWKGPET